MPTNTLLNAVQMNVVLAILLVITVLCYLRQGRRLWLSELATLARSQSYDDHELLAAFRFTRVGRGFGMAVVVLWPLVAVFALLTRRRAAATGEGEAHPAD